MRQAAADGAEISHLRVADLARGLRHHRQLRAHQRGGADLVMSGHRADHHRTSGLGHAGKPGHLAQVDHVPGLCQPQLHQRDQTLRTGKHFRVFTELLQQAQRLGHRRRRVILERSGVHVRPPSGRGAIPRCAPA